MKKIVFILCSVFVFSNLSYAMPRKYSEDKQNRNQINRQARKEKMENLRKHRMEFEAKLDALTDQFNNAKKKEREDIKKEVKALVSEKVDHDIVHKKEMLEIQKERIAYLEEEISTIEKDKEKYIEEQVEFFLSEEGQEKRAEFKERRNKRRSAATYK